MNVLQQLLGQKVLESEDSDGIYGLTLTDAVIAFYNPVIGAQPNECIGSVVSSVEVVEKDRMSIVFSNGLSLNVSLKDADYSGPEAFSVRFSDGTIIVQQ